MQELLVAFALHLDKVRHLHHFVDVAENLADALLLGSGVRRDRLVRHIIEPLALSSRVRATLAAKGRLKIRSQAGKREKSGRKNGRERANPERGIATAALIRLSHADAGTSVL